MLMMALSAHWVSLYKPSHHIHSDTHRRTREYLCNVWKLVSSHPWFPGLLEKLPKTQGLDRIVAAHSVQEHFSQLCIWRSLQQLVMLVRPVSPAASFMATPIVC